MSQSQFGLLRSRRFLPFFLTQTLGAFNDNLYKQALVLALLFKLGVEGSAGILVNLCALLFILPFFLFSALGGQLGERFPKDRLIRLLKLSECLIMLMGAVGFIWTIPSLLWVALFLMGTHSALFGPVKYALLPQHLTSTELVGGNALVETGTFLAILTGTLSAGLLMAGDDYAEWVAVCVLLVALAGYMASRWIPATPAVLPNLPLGWHLGRETTAIIRLGFAQSPEVSRALIANSWFWFIGATYLTQIPAYVKEVLQGDQNSVTLILTLFSIGIAAGSLCCEWLVKRYLLAYQRLVVMGSLGLSIAGLWLGWHSLALGPQGAEQSVWALLLGPQTGWIMLEILGLGFFGGIYIVPLYVLIQVHTKEVQRTRVIAAGNILNAVFMIASSLLAMGLLGGLGLSIPQLFLVVAVLNVLLNGGLFRDQFRQWPWCWGRASLPKSQDS